MNKAHLRGDGDTSAFSSSESSVAWKARLFLFLGFAFMAGGLAGSVVSLLLAPSQHTASQLFLFADGTGPQIYRDGVCFIPILWNRKHYPEWGHHAIRHHTMDFWNNGGQRVRLPAHIVAYLCCDHFLYTF